MSFSAKQIYFEGSPEGIEIQSFDNELQNVGQEFNAVKVLYSEGSSNKMEL